MKNFEKLSRAEMKNVLGGKPMYQATNNNPTQHCSPANQGGCAASCYVTCDYNVSTDGGQTYHPSGQQAGCADPYGCS